MSDDEDPLNIRYAETTVFDAVARRITKYNGNLVTTEPHRLKPGDLVPINEKTLRPKEALMYRRDSGLPKNPDTDYRVKPPKVLRIKDLGKKVSKKKLPKLYSYTSDLPPEVERPDGELLEAIHAYVSEFCDSNLGSEVLFGAMDGTALVAMGTLVEEIARDMLGSQGDLPLTESRSQERIARPPPLNCFSPTIEQMKRRTRNPEFDEHLEKKLKL